MMSATELLNAAIQHHQAGQLLEAERLYEEALLQQPNQPQVLYLLGLVNHQRGDLDAAVQWYRSAIAFQPDYTDAHNNLGVLMVQQGNLQQATVHYQAALQTNPNNPRVHTNLGVILQQLGQMDAAIAHYQTAIDLEPNLAAAHTNLGHALKELGQLDAAITSYKIAQQLMPTNPEAYRDLGDALQEQGRFEEAMEIYNRAIALVPNHLELQGSRIRALLVSGNLQDGFREYDHWRLTVASRPRAFIQPVWDGSYLEGQAILLYAETGSGMGDGIQFIRYAPLVTQMGGRVIVECDPSLVRLFQSVAGVEQVVPTGAPLPEFAVQASLMSLPRIFGTTLPTIPAQIPYLQAPAPTPSPIPHTLFPFKVGIVWGGNAEHSHDRDRSCPFAGFMTFLKTPGVAFYSLQKGSHRAELITDGEVTIMDVSHQLNDFADTAAVMTQLDLIITVDTAIAHLAGALGKPVWILLSATPDWRWLMERLDSPWYPTARLFRQSRRHDWRGVCQQVAAALEAEVAGFRQE
ncbi:MAG: glycosyltransferase family protein [Oscillatoriales cyanobacterium C42_A2020_001]|nr:glycosyltransferase family protein [Leptolyngbyaceae cyanobacterium C42_A2020_001]